jgi:hydrogenase maturation protease
VNGRSVLIAGIGNVFLGDDGFGVEAVRRIDPAALPPGARAADYGIRGVHLAYDLLDGHWDTLIMIDALPVDGPPGTLAVLDASEELGGAERPADRLGPPAVDGHGMHPLAVLHLLRSLGGSAGRALVVGCRPAVIEEVMGLSAPVRAAVAGAARLATELAHEEARRPGRKETARA